MSSYTKAQKRELRKMIAELYEIDLSKALEALYSHFQSWKRGEIDAFELNEEIHKHHNGISREQYKYYVMGSEESWIVAGGLLDGRIREEDLPPAIREKVVQEAENLKKSREMLE